MATPYLEKCCRSVDSAIRMTANGLTDISDAGLPWYAYALLVSGAGVIAWAIRAVLKLILNPSALFQEGNLVPRATVEMMMAAKDAEIAHLHDEIERWVGAFHIKDAAYTSLSESIEENTEAMNALLTHRDPRPRITEPEGTNGRRREPRSEPRR